MNDILNLLNTISQIIIEASSIVAIIIAIRQIRHKGKVDLKLSYSYGMGLYKHSDTERLEAIAGINIKLLI